MEKTKTATGKYTFSEYHQSSWAEKYKRTKSPTTLPTVPLHKDLLPVRNRIVVRWQRYSRVVGRFGRIVVAEISATAQRRTKNSARVIAPSLQAFGTDIGRNRPINGLSTGQHYINNPVCARSYSDDTFSVLSKYRCTFHLSALESTFIELNSLCHWKEFLNSFKISH